MSECELTLTVTRKIAAAHYLPAYDGPCEQMHGHTWKIKVWIRGPINPATDMVFDFRAIKMRLDELDHSVLNEKVGFTPTAERLAAYLLDTLPMCIKVRIWESDDCYVTAEKPLESFTAELAESECQCEQCKAYDPV